MLARCGSRSSRRLEDHGVALLQGRAWAAAGRLLLHLPLQQQVGLQTHTLPRLPALGFPEGQVAKEHAAVPAVKCSGTC